ncbi:hypothetical protein EVAR_19699_1 [Eumeta japonica]|uniref:Uncharacterized protein n=1 Tax=Eumeta variegata TaxID=151549 RepID=A0A4C1V3J1_EUMVA|nr:hypothetical protein EVAR_19699_1 [Eumeta japonica]
MQLPLEAFTSVLSVAAQNMSQKYAGRQTLTNKPSKGEGNALPPRPRTAGRGRPLQQSIRNPHGPLGDHISHISMNEIFMKKSEIGSEETSIMR